MKKKSENIRPHTPQMKFATRQKIVEALHINEEIISRSASINVVGNNHIHIENYKKILKYTQNEVIVNDRCKKIVIDGERLCIRYFFDGDIDISGIIASIRFEGLYK